MNDQKSNIMNIVKDYSLQEKITSCVFYSKVINQIKMIRDKTLFQLSYHFIATTIFSFRTRHGE